MAPSGPAVTNRTEDDRRGMTLRELITFVGDCLQAPAPVDQDAPLRVTVPLTGNRILTISAPLEACTCPEWPGSRTPLHHPACPQRPLGTVSK